MWSRMKMITGFKVKEDHPFIHFLFRLIQFRVAGGLEPIPAVIGVHPGQVASPSQVHTETKETNNHPC